MLTQSVKPGANLPGITVVNGKKIRPSAISVHKMWMIGEYPDSGWFDYNTSLYRKINPSDFCTVSTSQS